jgi:hypothetical protein
MNNKAFWDMRAEMTAQNSTGLDFPITLLECESVGIIS